MEAPRAPTPSRRAILLAGVGGLGGLAATLSGCSSEQRDALLDVDPRDIRLDRADPVPPRPEPSERERRRRAVLAGSLAALAAYRAAGDSVPALHGRDGGTVPPADAAAVHEGHLALLRGVPAGQAGDGQAGDGGALGDLVPGAERADGSGLLLPPARRPAAVLGAGTRSALEAAAAERAAEDADVALALLHARIAAARAAQARALAGAAAAPVWPGAPVSGAAASGAAASGAADADLDADVVAALQDVLAQRHRARWSYAVVQAWSTDRSDDAAAAREGHTERVEDLEELLRRLGAEPVDARSTYPTDTDGRPVADPAAAAALALRLEDAVTVATATVLAAAVTADEPQWVEAGVTALADAERGRWSWSGTPAVLPGG